MMTPIGRDLEALAFVRLTSDLALLVATIAAEEFFSSM